MKTLALALFLVCPAFAARLVGDCKTSNQRRPIVITIDESEKDRRESLVVIERMNFSGRIFEREAFRRDNRSFQYIKGSNEFGQKIFVLKEADNVYYCVYTEIKTKKKETQNERVTVERQERRQ